MGAIEEKWVSIWEEKKVFQADPDERREKVFVTVPFPYMNGPLHLGHALTDGRVDVYARFKRMQGYNTLYPYAWHWTGQPLVAAAERLANGDPAMVREFVEIEHIPKEKLERFYDPVFMAKYYTDEGRESLKRLGLSIDWRREFHTTDLEPHFNKFVLWQINQLREKGFITRGTHPVIWCPHDESPTGDHDRLEGEGVTWEEYVLVLFPSPKKNGNSNEKKLVAATLRPETLFAVTNLWVNPKSRYVEALVDGRDRWVVSSRAAFKLAEQLKEIQVIREFEGRELIGLKVNHPLTNNQSLLVLPGDFVDPDNGTGVVYGVPAHAPADYMALKDLENNVEVQREFGLERNVLESIKPIALISIPGFGEFPAIEISEKMKLRGQNDPRVSQATSEVYKLEFHQGVLNRLAEDFAGSKVSEAKPRVLQWLKDKGIADLMYELPEKVVCRCTTECIVKILQDQWFLKYSDPEWKRLAHKCIDKASIYPESARQWFHDVIDWFKDWPCARRVGLGTPLPWSAGWIVETLSDSTIYMAFYTQISTLRKFQVSPDSLTDALFSYVLLGQGSLDEVIRGSGLSKELIDELRRQFLYWYPVNLRNSAKELIPNHLTFFVFQHAAFFPEELWPTAISANGMLTNAGAKMSKSKGNVVTLKQGLDRYGSDLVRASVLLGSDGLDDVDWREDAAKVLEGNLKSLSTLIRSLLTEQEEAAAKAYWSRTEDRWLETKIQQRISNVMQSLDQMKTKSAFQEALFGFWNDIRYYLKRSDMPSKSLLSQAARVWIRLLSPFMPFTSEELNEASGGRELISTSRFPEPDLTKIHPEALLGEMAIEQLVEDGAKIKKLLRTPSSKLYLYVAAPWTYKLFDAAVAAKKKKTESKEVLKEFFATVPEVSKQEIVKTTPQIAKILNAMGENFLDTYSGASRKLDEGRIYEETLPYLKKELGVEVSIQHAERAEYDPKQKARLALPFKPALYFE